MQLTQSNSIKFQISAHQIEYFYEDGYYTTIVKKNGEMIKVKEGVDDIFNLFINERKNKNPSIFQK
jgi:uncharacterized protein YlzI (FlbEa/FlbD family)